MSPAEAVAVLAAGIGAGTINTIVGSGTLITFPVLLAVGLPPVTANVSNTLGLVPGSVSRRHRLPARTVGQREPVAAPGHRLPDRGRVRRRPPGQPALQGVPRDRARPHRTRPGHGRAPTPPGPHLQARRQRSGSAAPVHGGPVLLLGILLASVYGGYFGAAQGVLYLSLMGLLLDETLQRINGLKNVLAAMVNGIAALFFIVIAHMDWAAVGAHRGRRHHRRADRRPGRAPPPADGTARPHRRRRHRGDRPTAAQITATGRIGRIRPATQAGTASHSGRSRTSRPPSASSSASAGVGSNGRTSSRIPACSGVRSALRWLSSRTPPRCSARCHHHRANAAVRGRRSSPAARSTRSGAGHAPAPPAATTAPVVGTAPLRTGTA